MKSRMRLAVYAAGALILTLGAPSCLFAPTSGMSGWFGPIVEGVALGTILWAAHTSSHGPERAIGSILVALAASFLLYAMVSEETRRRREYQTAMPFLVGFAVALPLVLWQARKVAPAWRRRVLQSIVLTLLLAPLPFGPEGTLMPLIVTLILPPLVFLFLFLGRVLLSFLTCLGLLSALAEIRSLSAVCRRAVLLDTELPRR